MQTRADKIREEIADTPAEENGFEIPETPGRYLVIMRTMGDRVWAVNCETLEECARAINEDDTDREELTILDLDTDAELCPVLEVAKIMGAEGGDWTPPEPAPALALSRPLTSRELATVLASLRFWQRTIQSSPTLNAPRQLDAARHHRPDHFADCEPLDADEIDELCESINLAPPPVQPSPILAELETRFPWLKEPDEANVSGADAIEALGCWYESLKAQQPAAPPQPREPMACPFCKEGTLSVRKDAWAFRPLYAIHPDGTREAGDIDATQDFDDYTIVCDNCDEEGDEAHFTTR